jgi:hypothetical protein
MPTPGQELSTIDFDSMIGGPLIAVVNAQTQAAMGTINVIKQVGFKQAPPATGATNGVTQEPVYVDFLYPKELRPYGGPDKPAVYEQQKLSVPLLSIVPVPFIRIEEATIDFKARIDSVEYRDTLQETKVDAALEAEASWGWGSAKLNVGVSHQQSTKEGSNVARTYSMDVHIKAVQEEMPAGLQRVLHILEAATRSQPVGAPPPVTTDKQPALARRPGTPKEEPTPTPPPPQA